MKKPFQVGDRIAVYFGFERYTGTITEIRQDGFLKYVEDGRGDGALIFAHPKACRRLVKRKRRELWVNILSTGTVAGVFWSEEEAQLQLLGAYERAVHFVEAPKQKKNKEKD